MSIIFNGVEMPIACCFVDGEHSAFAHFEYCKFYNICEKRDTINTNCKPSDCPVKALEQEPRWISVSEKLPNIHNYFDEYLVTLKRGGVYIATFTEWNGKHWWTYDDVVAWMPLPSDYERGEEE